MAIKNILGAAILLSTAALAQEKNSVEMVEAAFGDAQKHCVALAPEQAEKVVKDLHDEYGRVVDGKMVREGTTKEKELRAKMAEGSEYRSERALNDFKECLEQTLSEKVPNTAFYLTGGVTRKSNGEVVGSKLRVLEGSNTTSATDSKIRLKETGTWAGKDLDTYIYGFKGAFGTDKSYEEAELEEEEEEIQAPKTVAKTAAVDTVKKVAFAEQEKDDEEREEEKAVAPVDTVKIDTAKVEKIAEAKKVYSTANDTIIANMNTTEIGHQYVADIDSSKVKIATASAKPKKSIIDLTKIGNKQIKSGIDLESVIAQSCIDSVAQPLSVEDIWFGAYTKPSATKTEPKIEKENAQSLAEKYGITSKVAAAILASMGLAYIVNRAQRREFERKAAKHQGKETDQNKSIDK